MLSLMLSTLLLLVSSACALTTGHNGRAIGFKLADGTSMQYGSTSNGLKWQSSGILYKGCNSTSRNPIRISDCYQLSLVADPTKQLDPGTPDSPRQRIEFLTPGVADNTTHKYSWKLYLSSTVGTSAGFFHLMQVFSRGDNGPIVTLDALSGKVTVRDYKRPCVNTRCPSVALSSFTDRTTVHTMSVTYGPLGKLNYVVSDFQTRKVILSYKVSGEMGSQSSSIKFGAYRATFDGMNSVSGALGDFNGS